MRFIQSLTKNTLFRATLLVAGLGVATKVVALFKDIVVASRFGVGREMDIFTLALATATFPVSLLASSLCSAYMPIYVGLRSQSRECEANAFQKTVRRGLGGGMLVLSFLVALSAPFWVPRMAPAWSRADQQRLLWVVILLLSTLPISSSVAQLASTLQGQRRFLGPAISPMLNSVAIMGILLMPLHKNVFLLSAGVITGCALEATALYLALHRQVPDCPQQVTAPKESLQALLRCYVPNIGSELFMCSTTLVDMLVAAWLPVGAIATLGYANKLTSVSLALSAGALSTTLFPSFSRLAGLGEWKRLRSQATKALFLSVVGSSLIVLVLFPLSPCLVKLIYLRGSFGLNDVAVVAPLQSICFLQIPFYIGSILMVRVIQSLQQHQINFYGTIINALLNFGLDLLFLPYLGVRGIALSTVCVYAVSFVFLAYHAYRLLRLREKGGEG